jgi:hypothetical protein
VREVEERIASAASRAGREPADVTLVAISKTFPVEAVVEAYEAGARHFGENRVAEGMEKVAAFAERMPAADATWHMVGHVQSRKAADVIGPFDVVHSVDRLKIARRFSRYAAEAERRLRVLLECNVSGEEAKYGFDLAGWEEEPARLDAFLDALDELAGLPRLEIRGLMTMAPLVDDAEVARPVFASLRRLRDAINQRRPGLGLTELSMGMTNDFEVAVEEGATMVRVGSALFL